VHLKSLFYSAVGVPPGRDAPRRAQLLWARRLYYRWSLPILIFLAIVFVLTGMGGAWWLLIGAGVGWLCGFAAVNLQILSEQRQPPST
jgi:hypothetical protein